MLRGNEALASAREGAEMWNCSREVSQCWSNAKSRPPVQPENERDSWSKTPWVEQGLRLSPSYGIYDLYELEPEMCPE